MGQNKEQYAGSSYNQIAKATGIFGGVQIFSAVLSIIRSKFVAILLGTAGVGIIGLYTAAISLISSITNLGINFSAVRTISEAEGSNNQKLIGSTIITARRWIYLTGCLGIFVTLIFSKRLSLWTFGNTQYTWAFIWLSITLFFKAVSEGQLAVLQGLRKLRQLAAANVIGSSLGLCFSLPLYYWYGQKGIVSSLIVTAAISLALSWYYFRKIRVVKTAIPIRASFKDGLDMVKLGSVMMVTGFATMGVTYLIRMYINLNGSLEQVGLYTAAWSIINGYVGMVFTAMGTDFFPRLSAVNKDESLIRKLVNEQAEIAILILGPIIILLITTLPIVIRILLTEQFLPMMGLIHWALIGVHFKAASWAVAFIMLAKGDSKMFFITEMIANVIILITNVLFFHFYKLEGIGFAFLLSYVLYLIIVYLIARFKYGFSFDLAFIKLFVIQIGLSISSFAIVWFIKFPKAYIPGLVIFGTSLIYSFVEVKKRIDIQAIIRRLKK